MPEELKRGLPSGPVDMPVKYDGCIDCVKQIYKSEGPLGFWKGSIYGAL